MIPYGSELCENCAKMAAANMKCYCICHTTDYIQCRHANSWEIPMKKHSIWQKIQAKIRGERYEIF